MFARQIQPEASLSGVVESYWQLQGPEQTTPQRHQQFAQHIWHLHFSSAGSWQQTAQGFWEPAPAADLESLRLGSIFVTTQGYQRRLIAELYPWAAKQLFGWALDNPPALAQASESQAISALLTLGDWQAAQEILQDWLVRLHSAEGKEGGKGVQAAKIMYASPAGTKIGDLAEELHLSQRQLEREFQAEIGVTPKALARLVRFDAAFSQMQDEPEINLTTLAYDLGFTDQSHLTREFKSLALMTPSEFQKALKERER